MTRPRLLDLFCCEGGAAVGYHRAGWDVVGVDIKPQPRYPFEFHQSDALMFTEYGFDAVHASPPCQAYSITRHTHDVEHPDLVGFTRERLIASGLPYVIENVPGAPLRNPVTLCGAAMGCTTIDDDGTPLVLRRHRLFESNILLYAPPCACAEYAADGYRVAGVYGGGSRDPWHARNVRHGGYTPSKARQEQLIGCDHMTLHGLAQAIPPAYTEWLGAQLLAALAVTA
jgi:DNA (cytosine-5)-methyltransferase 1